MVPVIEVRILVGERFAGGNGIRAALRMRYQKWSPGSTPGRSTQVRKDYEFITYCLYSGWLNSCKHYWGSIPRLTTRGVKRILPVQGEMERQGSNPGPSPYTRAKGTTRLHPSLFTQPQKENHMITATAILAVSIAIIVAYPTIEDYFYTGQHRATPHES